MVIKVRKSTNILNKMKGLLGESKPFPFWLQTRFGIHTFGMKFPIDVVILDNSLRVRKLKQNMRPNTFFFWNPLFQHVLELPAGEIKKLNIKHGLTVILKSL